MTREDAQTALNTYRFMQNGKDIYPQDAKDLTDEQLIGLEYHVHQVQHLKSLQKTESQLQHFKDKITA